MNYFERYRLSKYTVIGSLIIALILIGACNLSFLLTFLGFSLEHQFISSGISSIGSHALGSVDRFSFSASTSLLIFWSAVGLLVLGLVNAVRNSFASLTFDVEVATKFRHPKSFSQRRFWLAVVGHFAQTLIGIISLATSIGVLLLLALPFAVLCVRVFAGQPLQPLNAVYLLTGVLAVWISVLGSVISSKVILRR